MQTTHPKNLGAVTQRISANYASNSNVLLDHLLKVKSNGSMRWLACCPAHEDKSPSLSIRELDDGRILIKCFAGCSTEEVLSSVGLSFDSLYPPKEIHYAKPERRPFPAADILRAIRNEILIVFFTTKTILNGEAISPVDNQRLLLATSRIEAALEAGGIEYE